MARARKLSRSFIALFVAGVVATMGAPVVKTKLTDAGAKDAGAWSDTESAAHKVRMDTCREEDDCVNPAIAQPLYAGSQTASAEAA